MEILEKKTICLNMIVKDEAHIILETLQNLLQYITFDYWVISDTGSTDGTQTIIQNFFSEKGIPGEIVQETWVDFGFNRTKALEHAFNKSDYILIFDADDKIVGDFKLPKMLNKDRYLLIFGPGFSYVRPLLVTNRKKWCFKGVLHECLSDLEPMNGEERIEGDYYLISGRSGNRSKNPNKYFDDAIVLKRAFIKERLPGGDYGMACRYAFYCAQSYKDAGSNYWDNSIEWYKKVLTLDNWSQEKFYSCFTIGELYKHKKEYQNALTYWLKTIEYDSERIEGITSAIEHCYSIGQHILVNVLYNKFKAYNKDLPGKLFLHQDKYNDLIEYYNSISSFYTNDKLSGYQCCKKILYNKIVCDSYLITTMSNLQFYKEFLEKDEDTIELFYAVDAIFASFLCRDSGESKFFSLWNTLFTKNKDLLTMYKPTQGITNKPKVTVFLSMTTCKRRLLFEQTINSILNQWLDLDKIDYWFCVDDNSSKEDRTQMEDLYPWIDYYMKTGSEKGHRKSMNIIWNKIKELGPAYWIHIEDDFLFHTKMNYVSDAIQHLTLLKEEGVKQILFNRNYGEIIEHYNNKGHISIPENDSVVVHEWKQGTFSYGNCHYWPHYSFRPSLIDVEAILSLGNFDTENQFFELDYANRWFDAGYKSAFFNRITNKHIGRLTSERSTQVIKNAYELNNEEQFVNKPIINNIKIVNLERRIDRKEKIDALLKSNDITKYEFIKAVDGSTLIPTVELNNLFQGNDFGSRRGFIGCAMSHLNLWLQLLDDSDNEYYIIMEDDFTLGYQFKDRLEVLKERGEFEKDLIFMGYHMFKQKRETVSDIYENNLEQVDIVPLNKDLFIGGTHCYSIHKRGAQKLINYIKKHGIKHGIDYIMKIVEDLDCYESKPHLAFAEWNEGGLSIDTDIQTNYDSMDFTNILVPNPSPKKIAFFDNGLSERGTIVALYDYAHFNEEILGNTSYIFYEKNNPVNNQDVISKFESRFTGRIWGLNTFSDIDAIIEQENIDMLYLIKYGNNDGKLSTKCKNIVHCVFTCDEPHGQIYSSIAPWVKHNNGKYPCVPHMIHLPKHEENMREVLGIPSDAIVFGRHGGYDQFDIPSTHEAIIEYADLHPTHYFLFINTKPFCEKRPNIVHLDKIINLHEKVSFINTCDAMIHGRSDGEVFPLSIGEFSTMNKPIITTPSIKDNGHIELLGDKAVLYHDKESLLTIFINFPSITANREDWNAYSEYTPEKVMNIFKNMYITGNENDIELIEFQLLLDKFVFIPNVDSFNNDIYFHKKSIKECLLIADNDTNCIGVNTLGFFKGKLDNLIPSKYFKKEDGIYIKKEHYDIFLKRKSIVDITKNNVFLYWIGKEYKLIKIFRDLIYTHSTSGRGYNVILITPENIKDYIDTIPDYFYDLLPAHQADYVRVHVVCQYGGIWLDSDTLVMTNLDSLFDLLNTSDGFFIIENNSTLCNGVFGSKANTTLMLDWKKHVVSILDAKKTNILWAELGNDYLVNAYLTTSILRSYTILNGLDNLYPIGPVEIPEEFIHKPYDNYKNIIRSFQPLICLVNSAYKAYEILDETLIDNTPITYFIKTSYHNKRKEPVDNKNIRVKMLCNWCSSEQLCKEWSNMCEDGYRWKNIELICDNTNIDYYVIINYPLKGDYYDPSKTLVFQMEPWVKDESKLWGVKTWDAWALPDPDKFLHVNNHTKYLNAVQWQITTPLSELTKEFDGSIKLDRISSICSHKNHDEGHILRNEFIRYMDEEGFDYIDVYGKENYHQFECFKGPIENDEKVNGFKKYKYYFMAENNSEHNYATEKIWEPILCECLCFYWGCPNLEDYIDSQAFIRLDLNNKEESLKTIITAIKEDWWSQRIECIRREKQIILNELGFFPTLKKLLNAN